MKELFYEIMEEAKNGKIIIGDEIWPIGFNSVIYDNGTTVSSNFSSNNLSTLVIKNEEKFFSKLEEYVSNEISSNRKKLSINYRDDLKLLLAYLFVNATTEDFLNPIYYIDRRIDYLSDDTFEDFDNSLSVPLEGDFIGCNLNIRNESQSIMMETPNKITISISNDEGLDFPLPSISYGIHTLENGEKCCYVYSILNPKLKEGTLEEEKFRKQISRKLYKVNKGVLEQESSEYLEYREGKEDNDYYPENISDISPSSLLSLTVFLTMLKDKEIEQVRGVPYLPLRYLSRSLAAQDVDDINKKESLNKRNNAIQTNITNKFIRTFRRASYHIEDMEVVSYPYEFDEFLHVELGKEKTKTNNELLNSVTDAIENRNIKK